jgi:hypothetical protein
VGVFLCGLPLMDEIDARPLGGKQYKLSLQAAVGCALVVGQRT